jgi:hypothetical protein
MNGFYNLSKKRSLQIRECDFEEELGYWDIRILRE